MCNTHKLHAYIMTYTYYDIHILWHTHIRIRGSDIEAHCLWPTPRNIHACIMTHTYSHSYQWCRGTTPMPDATQHTYMYCGIPILRFTCISVIYRWAGCARRHTIYMRVLWHTHIDIKISDAEGHRLCPTTHNTHAYTATYTFGVATSSRLLKIIGLFCKRAL